MGKEKLKSNEFILLILYVNNKKPIVSHTKFQKLVFLFEKEVYEKYKFNNLLDQNLFKFRAYHYGPFSDRLIKDLEFLNNYGFVEIQNYNLDDNMNELNEVESKNYYIYKITDLGEKFVKERILNKLDSFQIEALENLKKGIEDIELNDLLTYVYRNYPDMIVNSKIADNYV